MSDDEDREPNRVDRRAEQATTRYLTSRGRILTEAESDAVAGAKEIPLKKLNHLRRSSIPERKKFYLSL